MAEIDKDKIEKLSELADICSGQEVRLTWEDIKAIKYARDVLVSLNNDMVAILEELISEANELEDPKYILETSELPLDVDGTTLPLETYALQCYSRGGEEVIDIIEKKINELNKNIL